MSAFVVMPAPEGRIGGDPSTAFATLTSLRMTGRRRPRGAAGEILRLRATRFAQGDGTQAVEGRGGGGLSAMILLERTPLGLAQAMPKQKKTGSLFGSALIGFVGAAVLAVLVFGAFNASGSFSSHASSQATLSPATAYQQGHGGPDQRLSEEKANPPSEANTDTPYASGAPHDPDTPSAPHNLADEHDSSAAIQPYDAAALPESPTQLESESKLTVRFLDVGQGDCAIISCNGHHMLIDGGPSRTSQKVFAVLRNLAISHLDYIVATHADADHVGGISAALNAATCATCFCSVAESTTKTFESMTRYVHNSNAAFVVPEIPTTLDLGDATVNLIGPVREFPDSDNNGSLVCRIDYGSTSFLFMGDAEEDAETSLVRSGADVHADVIKIGHHGSAHSTTSMLIDAVSPTAAIISVGADNPYGHPTKRVLDLLERNAVETYRTDIDGDVIAVSDGEAVSIRTTHATIDE